MGGNFLKFWAFFPNIRHIKNKKSWFCKYTFIFYYKLLYRKAPTIFQCVLNYWYWLSRSDKLFKKTLFLFNFFIKMSKNKSVINNFYLQVKCGPKFLISEYTKMIIKYIFKWIFSWTLAEKFTCIQMFLK